MCALKNEHWPPPPEHTSYITGRAARSRGSQEKLQKLPAWCLSRREEGKRCLSLEREGKRRLHGEFESGGAAPGWSLGRLHLLVGPRR